MMHSFEGLADEISALLKNAGDSGDSGDRAKITSRINDIGVTKSRAEVSPDERTLVTPPANFGDSKTQSFQSLKGGVTSATTVTKNFEEGRSDALCVDDQRQSHSHSAELDGSFDGLPSSWINGVARLRAMDMPAGFTADRWHHIVGDAEVFLRHWGPTAAKLGWSTHDLFGVHPAAPVVRLDAMGLIPLLHGDQVVALTENTATIRKTSGAVLRFNCTHKIRGVCLWEIHP